MSYGFRAFVQVDFMHRDARLLVAQDRADGKQDLLMADGTWRTIEQGIVTKDEPGIRFPHEALGAIAQAIGDHLGNKLPSQAEATVLREWLIVERERVEMGPSTMTKLPEVNYRESYLACEEERKRLEKENEFLSGKWEDAGDRCPQCGTGQLPRLAALRETVEELKLFRKDYAYSEGDWVLNASAGIRLWKIIERAEAQLTEAPTK